MDARMKAVFNWSGGKDSALALLTALRSEKYDVVSLLTTVTGADGRSTMHAIPERVLRAQAASIGIPLCTVNVTPGGEPEHDTHAMRLAAERFRAQGVTRFIFGDIFLHDVRTYREERLRPYGIEVVEPLWELSPQEAMEAFLASGLEAVITTTWAERLGREYIGRRLNCATVADFPAGIDLCGENGEYHTLCYGGSLFRQSVAFRLGEPYRWSQEVGMEDGSRRTFSYWTADIA